MALFKRVEKATDLITRLISLLSLTGLLLLASATVLDVALRWVFNRPIVGLTDTHSLFTAIIIAACFPLCIFYKGNISIRFLGSFLGTKARNILDAFGYFVMTVIFALMGWTLWHYANEMDEYGSTTFALGWPISPWWRIVTIIIYLCVPVAFVTAIQYLMALKKNTGRVVIHESTSRQSIEEGH